MPSSDDPSPKPPASGHTLLDLIREAFHPRTDLKNEVPATDLVAQASETLEAQARAFRSLKVSDVMTPRADIVGIEASATLAEVLSQFLETEHSRLPIYSETLDDPIGVVHVKDVLKILAPSVRPPEWSEMLLPRLKREVLYVPAAMRTADLMLRMQTSRLHMALVIDEFGGVEGLVTLEDLVEAVVGDIDDEYDIAGLPQLSPRADGRIDADARIRVDHLEAELGLDLKFDNSTEDYDTLAGLVSALAGRVPQVGQILFHPRGPEFEILEADPRRVKRVRIYPVRRIEPQIDGPDGL